MKPIARRAASYLAGEERDELIAQTINCMRHDWMNDIQVLYGYLKLKKYDKMQDYMENLKTRMIRESGISKLGVPALVVYLQSFRVRCPSVRLEVEPEPGVQLAQLALDEEAVAEAIVAALESIARRAGEPDNGDVNRLKLGIGVGEGVLAVRFEYAGRYDRDGLLQELHEAARLAGADCRIRDDFTMDDEGAAFGIYVPLGK
jgi:hypothetical protein